MATRAKILAAFLAFFVAFDALDAFVPVQTLKPSFPDAISDLKETVVKGLGPRMEGWEVSGFDARDALVGQTIVYDFHLEVDEKVFPIRLLGDVNWSEFVDLPVFRSVKEGKELAEIGKDRDSDVYPVLSPFQLAGPMELWIQDADDMRLSLPHDVDAGVLKKVILADGAVVTIKGARSVSLRHPVELPLPFNQTNHRGRQIASGLLSLAEALRDASRSNEKSLVSLRVVGPTSLASLSSTSPNDQLRLKLKRLAPGLVQLSSPFVPAISENRQDSEFSSLWPLISFNSSDTSLMGFEKLLVSILGEKANKDGSFRLAKAEVSTKTFVKSSFQISKSLVDAEVDWSGFPGWRTRPEKATSYFEVLARIEDNGKILPERITEVEPFKVEESILPSVLSGNMSMSKMPILHPPPVFFTL